MKILEGFIQVLVLMLICGTSTAHRCPRYCADNKPGEDGWGYGCSGHGGWGHWSWGPWGWGYGYCGVVCARDANSNTKEFPNMCSLYRQNCINSDNKYIFIKNGTCEGIKPTTPLPLTTTAANPTTTWKPPNNSSNIPANDVSKHPNIGLINGDTCGMVQIDPRILNGYQPKLFQYPWMALVVVSWGKDNFSMCGGSVLNNRYVLTAGHCVLNDKGTQVQLAYVLLGVHDYATDTSCEPGSLRCQNPPQAFTVSQILPHPGFGKTAGFGDDLALLRLNTEATLSVAVTPICLPVGRSEQARVFNGEMLTVAGWGLTAPKTPTTKLMAAEVPGVTNINCTQAFNNFQTPDDVPVNITPGQMCAGGKNKDACQGDSGGPLFYPGIGMTNRRVQYGLVSYGPDCVKQPLPGVYTRVGFYMKWILDNMYA